LSEPADRPDDPDDPATASVSIEDVLPDAVKDDLDEAHQEKAPPPDGPEPAEGSRRPA
jgi:hypothetical protein